MALAVANDAQADEQLLVLLSGGASALMALPADGVTLEDKRRTTGMLLRSGADIHALNTVRKHLSAIKGGWLAAQTSARCRTLAISDVVGDDLSVVGSGPTVADATRFADARDVMKRHGGFAAYPPAVMARIMSGARGELPDTPKPGDSRLARSKAAVIGGRREAMQGAADGARALGYAVLVLEAPVIGEARVTAKAHMADVLARARSMPRPLCVVSSGETTVTVTGSGRGGRNQEFALASADALRDSLERVVLASVGTDGVDGPTDAAGAFVDTTTIARGMTAALPAPQSFLTNNDAHAYFDALGDLIKTGPTGTNTGDIQVMLFS
jgi:hydroxypyruvate reductase